MSETVCLCVGQCGIQLGQHVIESQQVVKEEIQGAAPLILVDSESKVIRGACGILGFRGRSGKGSGMLDDRNVISSKGCSGNNWGSGNLMGREPYNIEGTFSSYSTLGERVLDSVRRSVERLDSQGVTMLFHSLGGGTGSGLGSHLLELHREHFPKRHLHSVAVLPHSCGESPLQYYNSLLSLTAIQEFADSCLTLYNDEFNGTDISYANASTVSQLRNQCYTFQDINSYFARGIWGLFHPASSLTDKKQSTSYIHTLMGHLCPDLYHKFFTLHQVSSKTANPAYLLKQVVAQKLKLYSAEARNNLNTHSAVFVTRGVKGTESAHAYENVKDQLARLLYTSQTARKSEIILHSDNSFPCNERTSVTLGLNSSLSSEFFQRVITRSSCLLSHRAYLHWYEKYGVTVETFQESLESLNALNFNYLNLKNKG